MNRTDALKRTIEKLDLVLPEAYIEYLKSDEPNFELEIDNAYWSMATALESDWDGQAPLTLESEFSLDRITPVPFVYALKMFLRSAEDFLEEGIIQCENGKDFTTERLLNGSAIGEENGDLLFLDSETEAVYAFYHDGFYISKVSDSFSQLLQLTDSS